MRGLETLNATQHADFIEYLGRQGLSFTAITEPAAESCRVDALILLPTPEGEPQDFAISYADIVACVGGGEGYMATRAYNCLAVNVTNVRSDPILTGQRGVNQKLFSYREIARAILPPSSPDSLHRRINNYQQGGSKTIALIEQVALQKSREIEAATGIPQELTRYL